MILRFKDFDPINEVVKNLKSTQAMRKLKYVKLFEYNGCK